MLEICPFIILYFCNKLSEVACLELKPLQTLNVDALVKLFAPINLPMIRETRDELRYETDYPDMELRKRKNNSFGFTSWFSSRNFKFASNAHDMEEFGAANKKPAMKKSNIFYLFLMAIMVVVVVVWYPSTKAAFKPETKDRTPITTDWHKKVSDLRANEVINSRYDNIYVSILIADGNFAIDADVHTAIGTFLRQVKHLQVCNSYLANTFVGGEPSKVLPFFVEVPELPRLERYVDAFKTMYETAPELDWYIQMDDGIYSLTQTRFCLWKILSYTLTHTLQPNQFLFITLMY
jgi:hypothetical protein